MWETIKERILWAISGVLLCLLVQFIFWSAHAKYGADPAEELKATIASIDQTVQRGREARDKILEDLEEELKSIDKATLAEVFNTASLDLANIMLEELAISRSRDRTGLPGMGGS